MTAADREFGEYVALATGRLLGTARLLTGDWHLGEDLLQVSFAKVYARWGHRGEWESPLAYTRRVMVNTYCSWRRRRWHGEILPAVPVGAAESTLDSTAATADLADGVVDADTLNRALRRLGRRQRTVVVLRYYEDLSVAQTAEFLGCRPGTVTSLATRALAQLRRDTQLRDRNEVEAR